MAVVVALMARREHVFAPINMHQNTMLFVTFETAAKPHHRPVMPPSSRWRKWPGIYLAA